jgi:hypothetical protein
MAQAASGFNSARQLSTVAASLFEQSPPSVAPPHRAARELSVADTPAAHGESEPSPGVTVQRDSLGGAAAVAPPSLAVQLPRQ